MQQLTPTGHDVVADIAARYSLSTDSVLCMLAAVHEGDGMMAQFDCPELGGWGQWMQGGMVMISDPLDQNMRAAVDGVCDELSKALATNRLFATAPPGGSHSAWWPAELGAPSSTGSQDGTRYAVFPNQRRLVVEREGRATVYDTLDHRIDAISQQQGGAGSLAFGDTHGAIDLASLPVVSNSPTANTATQGTGADQGAASTADVLETIAALARLRDEGALSEDEFAEKKRELLARI